MGYTRRGNEDGEDQATVDLFLMKVGMNDGDEVAQVHRRTLSELRRSSGDAPLSELGPGDVEAYLDGLEWHDVSEAERAERRAHCERFLRFAARVRPDRETKKRAKRETPSSDRPARRPREPGKLHRKVWLGPFGSLFAAIALVARDPWSTLAASFGAWLLASVVPVIGAGPAGVGMTHVMARLDEDGKVDASEILSGFRRLPSSVFASVVQLIVLGVIAAIGAGLVYAFLWLGDAAEGLGDLPQWLAGAALIVLVVTAIAALLVGNWFLFVFPLIARKGLSALEACDASRDAARDHWVQILLVELAFGLAAIVCNAVPFVGVILALALWYALVWVLYRKLFE